MGSHCCPAKAGCADSKRRAGNELSLFRACRDLKRRSGWFGRRGRQTMAHESGPHRLFAIDQLPSRPGVPPLRRALSGRPPAARIFLLGSVSGHGLRATDLSGKFARHRGLSAFDVAQTFPIGQLREGHGQILIPAGKSAQPEVALIALDATAELPVGKEADQLRKDGAALIHEPLSAVPAAQTSRSDGSNRGKLETDSTHYRPVACCRHILL